MKANSFFTLNGKEFQPNEDCFEYMFSQFNGGISDIDNYIRGLLYLDIEITADDIKEFKERYQTELENK